MLSPHGYCIISYFQNWQMLAKLLYTFVNKNKLKDCPLTNAQIGMQQKNETAAYDGGRGIHEAGPLTALSSPLPPPSLGIPANSITSIKI